MGSVDGFIGRYIGKAERRGLVRGGTGVRAWGIRGMSVVTYVEG